MMVVFKSLGFDFYLLKSFLFVKVVVDLDCSFIFLNDFLLLIVDF